MLLNRLTFCKQPHILSDPKLSLPTEPRCSLNWRFLFKELIVG